jgi:CheY-like chemotaxis protein
MTSMRKTIVVVEDEPDTAEMFEEMMKLGGFEVIKTYGGTTALSTITRVKPIAVLLDIMMPDLSGLEVLRYIRRDPRLEHIPVVVVSARNLPEDIQMGMEAGASLYLSKPVSFQDLRTAIEQVTGAVSE